MKSIFKIAGITAAALMLSACAVKTLNLPVPGTYNAKPGPIGHQQAIVVVTKDSRSRGVLDENGYLPDYPVKVSGDMTTRLQGAMAAIIKARGYNAKSSGAKNPARYMTVSVNDVHMWLAAKTLQRKTQAEVVLTVTAHNAGRNYQRTYTGKALHTSIVPNTKNMNVILAQQAFNSALTQVYNDTKLWKFFNQSKALWMLS